MFHSLPLTSYFQLRSRDRQVSLLITLIALVIVAFWAWELRHALTEIDQRQEQALAQHQERELERKGEVLRDIFHEVYRSTRTISLLPMIRSIKGENRRSPEEDVVAQGRMSMDAHRTVQQVYANLQHNVRVSEVYYVLDGFDPAHNVPFFTYDEWIVGDPTGLDFKPEETAPTDDAPPESEDDEYRHFPRQLSWFRQHAPEFRWSRSLDETPVRLSPVMRTSPGDACPN